MPEQARHYMLVPQVKEVSRGVNPSSREGESQTGDWMAGLLL